MSYLAYRAALLRMAATYSTFASCPTRSCAPARSSSATRPAPTVYRASLALVTTYRDEPPARSKLNEPDAACGIGANSFDRIYLAVANDRNASKVAEMAAYYEIESRRVARGGGAAAGGIRLGRPPHPRVRRRRFARPGSTAAARGSSSSSRRVRQRRVHARLRRAVRRQHADRRHADGRAAGGSSPRADPPDAAQAPARRHPARAAELVHVQRVPPRLLAARGAVRRRRRTTSSGSG